jgi:membrane fusion protein, multidrug efflux system
MPSGNSQLARNVAGKTLAAAVYTVTIVLVLYVTRIYLAYPQTDDPYVRANIVGIAPHISGPIVDMPIRDNQRVTKRRSALHC